MTVEYKTDTMRNSVGETDFRCCSQRKEKLKKKQAEWRVVGGGNTFERDQREIF